MIYAGIIGVVIVGLLLLKKLKTPNNMNNIDGNQFAEMAKENNTVIIDVRTAGECQAGMIPNALHIDIMSGQFASKIQELDKDKTYLVYCRSGNRSASACGAMESQGFTNCYNLIGGVGACNGPLN